MNRPRRLLVTSAALLLATAAAADDALTMWRIDGEQNVVFLLGSVHLLRDEDYPLSERIDEAYEEAESLLMELDMDDLDPLAAQAVVTQKGVLRDGRTLADLLGPEAWAAAERGAQAIDIPIAMLSGTEPWLAAVTVEQMVLSRIGFDASLGVEMFLTKRAVRDGKPVEGLETVVEQITFLDELSADAQRDLLLQTLEDSTDASEVMDSMIAAWKRGDVGYLESELLDEMRGYPELYETIVAARNRRWIDTLKRLIDDEDDYLVVVGALHLVGPDGVPALLARDGISIEQVTQ